ncbi:MAG: CRISPR-associated endonuclease Cas6 [Zestosphaera sp.]
MGVIEVTYTQDLGIRVRTCVLSLILDSEIEQSYASKLRGYVGSRFRDFQILHNHIGDLGYVYSYPLVQYKVISGHPIIIGVGAGAEAVKIVAEELDSVLMGGRRYKILSKKIEDEEHRLGPLDGSAVYEFLSPWLALNKENYGRYSGREPKGRILRRVLIGNVLSLCKGLSHQVRTRLRGAVFVKEVRVEYKGVPMIGFTGRFIINYELPPLLGLGKGVSQGFGTFMRVAL